jgi:diadenosine tetraphosphate (Ap4A) HIT family hydrolase
MIPKSQFQVPLDLPPHTALALFELLNSLADALWQHYEPDLVELIMDDINAYPATQQSFDFNDDLPF